MTLLDDYGQVKPSFQNQSENSILSKLFTPTPFEPSIHAFLPEKTAKAEELI